MIIYSTIKNHLNVGYSYTVEFQLYAINESQKFRVQSSHFNMSLHDFILIQSFNLRN